MFGTREAFEYFECCECGCVQIAEIPGNIAAYYSRSDYYSVRPQNPRLDPVRRWLKHQRARYALKGHNPIGWVGARRYGIPHYYEWFRRAGVGFSSSILDVGSGSGFLLLKLSEEGFKNLLGIDPFISDDMNYGSGVRILKRTLAETEGEFDLVMLNHSFEHMPDPLETLRHVRRVMKQGGYAAIRTPLASSYAYKTYGADWVGLDAPRHLILYTEKGLHLVAVQAELAITDIFYDSEPMQFWGSEQYRRGISLYNDERSLLVNPANSVFSAEELCTFEKRTAELNRGGQGDQACFLLRKVTVGST